MAGKALLVRCDFLRRAFGYDLSAAFAAFGAKIDNPVGSLDDVQVVFDYYYGIAVVSQPMQHFQQQIDILEMKTGSGFVENVEGAAGIAFGKFSESFTRWASPPDSVVADWPRVM